VFRPVPVACRRAGSGDLRQRVAHAARAEAQLRGVAGELLAERDRHGVHEVRAARLDDVANASALACSDASSASSAGISRFVASSSAARCTALGKTSFDDWPMLTWSLGWAPSPGEVRDDLVGVHVRRRARAGLEDVDRELLVVLAGRDLLGRRRDALGEVASSSPELAVDAGRGALDLAQPADHRHGHPLARDREVVHAFVVSPPQSCSVVAMSVTACSQGFAPVVRSWLKI
jgi:hypothetical protein